MPLLVPDEGERKLLLILVSNFASWRVRLYQNDVMPSNNDTIATYTDADFSGYLAGGITPANWTGPATDGSGNAFSNADEIEFLHNGGGQANTIYGYYVTHVDGQLLWSERFTASVSMSRNGDSIKIRPQLLTNTKP